MSALLKWLLLLFTIALFSPQLDVVAAAMRTNAEAVALIDGETGRVLYAHNGNKRMRIASLTKTMTAIVAIEHGNMKEMVTISKQAFGKEGSSLYLKLGEKMSLENLVYGLMLRSGNDAAVAIAEHVGGSLEGFVYLMNEKAAFIGMSRSYFSNPHGLDDSEHHYSTANDMARLTRYAMRHPMYRKIVATKLRMAENPNESWDYRWYNKNKLLSLFKGADGGKTGFTKLAKRCLISSATRNGQRLIVVTLNNPTDWVDHMRLFEYGFRHYPLRKIAYGGERIPASQLEVAETVHYPLRDEEVSRVVRRVNLKQGTLVMVLDSKKIAQVRLVSANRLREGNGRW